MGYGILVEDILLENIRVSDSTSSTGETSVSESDGDYENTNKGLFIEGICMQSNVVNKNRRIYPLEVMQEAVDDYMANYINRGTSFGELDHPTGDAVKQLQLKNASHKFVKVWKEGTNFMARAEVLEGTPCGDILAALIRNGTNKIGISSRAMAEFHKDKKGVTVIDKMKIITAGDIVANPSSPNAFVTNGSNKSQASSDKLTEDTKEINMDSTDSIEDKIKKQSERLHKFINNNK